MLFTGADLMSILPATLAQSLANRSVLGIQVSKQAATLFPQMLRHGRRSKRTWKFSVRSRGISCSGPILSTGISFTAGWAPTMAASI
jgi:hypothetical protein